MAELFFVTGIDTDVGKTIVTGCLAREQLEAGHSAITQKPVQTGNTEISEDILVHRRLMGMPLQQVDHQHLTCPVIFPYPASPHLAAELAGRTIDFARIRRSTAELAQRYDFVFIEGAGGLMTPLTREITTLDYVAAERLPVILVTTPRLGSINHTLLTLQACRDRAVTVHMLVYNQRHPLTDSDAPIARDTAEYLRHYLQQHFPDTRWRELARQALPSREQIQKTTPN